MSPTLRLPYQVDVSRSSSFNIRVNIIESIVSEIKDQPRLFYENSIDILYNLAEAYEILGKLEESKSYYKQALNEMNRIGVNLNNEHRDIFLKNNKINNNMSFHNS